MWESRGCKVGQGYNFEQLKAEMLSRSKEQDWPQAKLEWDLWDVFKVGEEQVCLCGHHPIFQICTLKNHLTHKQAEVGNVCVEKFLGMHSKRVFSALRRIRTDNTRSLNKDAVEMFMRLGAISAQEAEEYLSFYRKRKHVTEDQKKLKIAVNAKVLAYADRRAAESEARYRELGK